MRGKVYLVGAGPGKSDLITLRGLNILKEADVVIYDYLVDREILQNAKETAELVCCDKVAKKGRYSDNSSIQQKNITDLVIEKAKKGKNVIRLKNGNPCIFSRLHQELDELIAKKIEFEIVPGITAASAASSLTGIPLTDRDFASSCVFVTGVEDPRKNNSSIDWDALAKSGTVVLYMGVGNLETIVKKLLKAGKGKDTDVAIIQNISLPTQRVLTGALKDIVKKAKRERIKPPAIIIVGKVVSLEKRCNWLKKNKRVLFTGLSKERFFIDGTYFHLPLIKMGPLSDYREFDNYLKGINRFDWIVFASRYGVEYFFKRLKLIGGDVRALKGIKMAVVGNSTKERLLDFGILSDLVPKNESSLGLVERFKKEDLSGKKIFMPRSDLSDKGLEKALERLGARVTTSVAYKNTREENLPDLDLNFFDEIMFTSPS
ncbi:MAG: uroporphyrinogen-III C-methyltransferase, partial [Candidatus Omnitrophota bacterium]|nr:uroporphyrinogen-III C-methyltransferase [Candidatus Omnitrophota bacterium]